MNTIYKKPVLSPMHPYQVAKKMTFDVQNVKHPARREVLRNVGKYELTAEFIEDSQTLSLFRHIPGLIAYICTLSNTKTGSVLGQGRGTAVLSKINRYVDRSVAVARNASLIDSVIRATKAMEDLNLGADDQGSDAIPNDDASEAKVSYTGMELPESFNEKTSNQKMISAKQKEYLRGLIAKIKDDFQRERWLSGLDNLTSSQASDAIQSLKK